MGRAEASKFWCDYGLHHMGTWAFDNPMNSVFEDYFGRVFHRSEGDEYG
jgi:hypothetical protein